MAVVACGSNGSRPCCQDNDSGCFHIVCGEPAACPDDPPTGGQCSSPNLECQYVWQVASCVDGAWQICGTAGGGGCGMFGPDAGHEGYVRGDGGVDASADVDAHLEAAKD
ncbi:MAG TPA: hypothetical protein VE987_18325 [Polyangiaceae bacterium]|nr:hypothetical protein [Polyangiaceae bacterium]